MKNCPACKKELDENFKVCPYCGQNVAAPVGAAGDPAPKKTKRIIFAAVLVLLAIGIAVFVGYRIPKGKTDEPTVGQTVTAADASSEAAQEETEPEPESETETETAGTAQTNTEWIAAYKNCLLDRIDRVSDEENTWQYFSLIYLDDDDVPELVVSEGDFHPSTASIITFYDGKVKTFSGLGSYGSFGYKEKQGVIVEGYTGSGVSSSNVWRLEKGELTCVWSGEEDMFDEDTEYYIFDANVLNELKDAGEDADYDKLDATRKEISEAEFKTQYDAIVPTALTASPVNTGTSPKMTRKNVNAYFAALADKSAVTRVRTFTEFTVSGTAGKEETDYNGSAYHEFVLDEPILAQFEDDAFPSLLTSVRIAAYDMDSVPSGHTKIKANLYKDRDDVVWCSVA